MVKKSVYSLLVLLSWTVNSFASDKTLSKRIFTCSSLLTATKALDATQAMEKLDFLFLHKLRKWSAGDGANLEIPLAGQSFKTLSAALERIEGFHSDIKIFGIRLDAPSKKIFIEITGPWEAIFDLVIASPEVSMGWYLRPDGAAITVYGKDGNQEKYFEFQRRWMTPEKSIETLFKLWNTWQRTNN